MRDVFDIYTIIFLALAVFIFLRLRSVLGQRTGRERPPYDPYAAREPVRPGSEKVVALPNRTPDASQKPAEPAEPATPVERWAGVAAVGSPVAAGLDAIFAADPTFDGKHFVTGARAAYEMIVNAYAEGDRRTLKNLLSREVYDGFESAINEREKARRDWSKAASSPSTRRRSPRPSSASARRRSRCASFRRSFR